MGRTLTLLDSGVIDYRTIDRILQSVVFFADSIAVRSSYEVASHDRNSERAIDARLRDLHQRGLLIFWAHEYEVDDGGRPSNRYGARKVVGRVPDLVISRSSMSESLGDMNEALRTMREEAYRQGSHDEYRQGLAEVVSLRNHLASLVVSSQMRHDGLLANPSTRIALHAGLRHDGETFQASVVREVVGLLQLGSLRSLTPGQIDECRKYSASFRKLLDDSLVSVSRGMHPVLTPEAIARELVSKYQEIRLQFAMAHRRLDLADDLIWDVLGATVPPSVFLRYGVKAFNWRKAASRLRPYLMLIHLEKARSSHSGRYG